MKTFRLLATLLLIAVCAGFSSCGDDELDTKPLEPVIDEITINNASFDFEANGGEETLSFSTNRDWTVSLANIANGEKWCTVTPLKGKAGDNNIQIRVVANKGYDDRNVSLTIAAGGTSRTVIINQKQQDALTLTANKFEVGKNGGKINVEVKANIQYEVIISETSKSWISQSAKTRGLTSNNLSFDIAPSEEYDKRTGEIIIQSGELSETVHVYQSGEGVLLLTKSEYSVSDKGETIAVDLKSNFEFDVKMPDVDWVQSAAKTRGMSSHTLYYTIAPNETYDSREAEIIFYDKNSNIKDTLKIMQAQKDAIIIGKKEYKISANEEIIKTKSASFHSYSVCETRLESLYNCAKEACDAGEDQVRKVNAYLDMEKIRAVTSDPSSLDTVWQRINSEIELLEGKVRKSDENRARQNMGNSSTISSSAAKRREELRNRKRQKEENAKNMETIDHILDGKDTTVTQEVK